MSNLVECLLFNIRCLHESSIKLKFTQLLFTDYLQQTYLISGESWRWMHFRILTSKLKTWHFKQSNLCEIVGALPLFLMRARVPTSAARSVARAHYGLRTRVRVHCTRVFISGFLHFYNLYTLAICPRRLVGLHTNRFQTHSPHSIHFALNANFPTTDIFILIQIEYEFP